MYDLTNLKMVLKTYKKPSKINENLDMHCICCQEETMGKNVFMQKYYSETYIHLYSYITNYKVHPKTEIPSNICRNCQKNLIVSYTFIKKVKESRFSFQCRNMKADSRRTEICTDSLPKNNVITPQCIDSQQKLKYGSTFQSIQLKNFSSVITQSPFANVSNLKTYSRRDNLVTKDLKAYTNMEDISLELDGNSNTYSDKEVKLEIGEEEVTNYELSNDINLNMDGISTNDKDPPNDNIEMDNNEIGKIKPKRRRKPRMRKKRVETLRCRRCGEIFEQNDEHRNMHFKQMQEELVKCKKCDKSLKRVYKSIPGHMKSHSDTIYQCSICGKILYNLNSIRHHNRYVHKKKARMTCNIWESN